MALLHWLSRDLDVQATKRVPYRLLAEIPKLSYGDKSSRNMLVQGDNLEALKAILPFYAGQVQCIYIDPPFNTGQALPVGPRICIQFCPTHSASMQRTKVAGAHPAVGRQRFQ